MIPSSPNFYIGNHPLSFFLYRKISIIYMFKKTIAASNINVIIFPNTRYISPRGWSERAIAHVNNLLLEIRQEILIISISFQMEQSHIGSRIMISTMRPRSTLSQSTFTLIHCLPKIIICNTFWIISC